MASGRAPQEIPRLRRALQASARARGGRGISQIAEKHRLPLAGIALAFVRSRFFTASTIIGATTTAQLDELAQWFDATLSPQ
jgi:aryl-alcohol dehydrogenase-like predicted oxidoreductase